MTRSRSRALSRLALLAGIVVATSVASVAPIGLAGSVAEAHGAPGLDAEIAYVRRTVSGGGDIYATTVDGRRTRRITRSYRRERDLAVSPDGTRIAFTMREPGTTNGFPTASIWVVAAAGGRPTRLTHGGSDHDPAWADDGRTLLFSRVRTGGDAHDVPADEIDSVNIADSSIKTLVPADFSDGEGTCWEDLTPWPGRKLTIFLNWGECLRNHSGPSAEALDGHGRVVGVLPWLGYFVWDPAISPDGRRIAYYAEFIDGREGGVFVAPIDGSRRRRLNATGAPSWSPNGRQLALVRNGDIWLVDPDGSTGRRLTTERNMEESPVWLRLRRR